MPSFLLKASMHGQLRGHEAFGGVLESMTIGTWDNSMTWRMHPG